MRFFETLASGGTLLTSSCPEFADEFPDGIASFYFDSPEALVARVKDLLPRGDLRKAVAEEGQRRVLAGHTYVDRGRQLLRLLELDAR
jgi:spore maturation protein CgeB